MTLRLICWTTAIAFVLSGCSLFEKPKRNKNTGPLTTIFVHGDPHQFIEGTDQNPQSFLLESELNQFDNFDLAAGVLLVEREEVSLARSEQDIEDGNEAQDGSEAEKLRLYAFERNGAGYAYRPVEGGKLPTFQFVVRDGRLEFDSFVGFQLAAEAIHYSITPDRSSFSILLDGRDATGDFLYAFVFSRAESARSFKPNVDTRFNYLLGPGVLAGWESEIKIQLCGSSRYDQIVEQSLRQWESQGRIGNLPLTIERLTTFKPFSDVNQHCIQMIDSYFFEDRHTLGNRVVTVGGVTMPVISKTKRTLVGGDIFISLGGLRKLNCFERLEDPSCTFPEDQFRRTVAHEMGHFLGLDHEFEKDARGEPLYRSIMSYERVNEVTPHDSTAISLLYGSNP